MESKEQRVRNITHLYYSRKDVQKTLFEFSKNREIVPRYFEGFGTRPDTFQYPGDVFELVKKGTTSFHCSEELWQDPLKISIEMNEKQFNELRIGWDFILDIDSKYLDYSKILVELIIRVLKFYGVKNYSIKFSGSKGFHILIPWKAFPKKINQVKTSDKFPEWPRILVQFLVDATKKELTKRITSLTINNKYIKDQQAPREVMPDLIAVSPRHLFRMPYSLHEKTALASAVLDIEEIADFQPKDADPIKVKVKDFMPNAEEGEATELLREALDWYKQNNPEEEEILKKQKDFKPIKLSEFSEENFPPVIKQILKGVSDGRKRSLFILINFFRSIGMEKNELERYIYSWNGKNEIPLKIGYIKTQLVWSYRNKIVPPPNYDKDYYKGIGIFPTEEEIRYKNPSNYMIKKSLSKIQKKPKKRKGDYSKDNFKNKS